MYALIGLPRLMVAYATAAAIVTVSILVFDLAYMAKVPLGYAAWIGEGWGAASKGLSVAAVLFAAGQTRIFPWACRLRWLKRIIPDIDGRWVGRTESNWPQVFARAGLSNQGAVPTTQAVPIRVTIKARLFSVRMSLESDTQYSRSETIALSVSRHGTEENLRLSYVYENYTPHPQTTDSGHHYGAACIDLYARKDKPSFEGNYWTNRNWQKGLNTAGRILLNRDIASGSCKTV